MMVCYQHSFPISNRGTTVCIPYAHKEKGNAANVAFVNQIDHWSGLSLGFLRCRASSSACAISTIARMSVPALSPISSILASACNAASRRERSRTSPLSLSCRREISLLTAVTMNCALVSEDTSKFSISVTTSWGKRAFICCERLLIVVVDIEAAPYSSEMQYTCKMNPIKHLLWASLYSIVSPINGVDGIHLMFASPLEGETPSVSLPLTGFLTTTDNASIEVAMINGITITLKPSSQKEVCNV